MLIERKVLVPETAMPVPLLTEYCMGCKDCRGVCMDLIQMRFLPDVLAGLREKRS